MKIYLGIGLGLMFLGLIIPYALPYLNVPLPFSLISPNSIKDAYVSSRYANTNFGTNLAISVGESYYTSGGNTFPEHLWGFIEFNLPVLTGARLNSATLKLYIVTGERRSETFYRITSPWSETSITWNNQPTRSLVNTVSIYTSASGWLSIDLTAMVKDAYAIANVFGVAIEDMGPDYGKVVYSSREGAQPPVLEIDYTVLASYTITFNSNPVSGVPVTIDGAVAEKTSFQKVFVQDSEHTISVPSKYNSITKSYDFKQWEDGSISTSRILKVTGNAILTAYYTEVVPPNYTLTLVSTPIKSISCNLDMTATLLTDWSGKLAEGTHTITIPASHETGGKIYNFKNWEDASTNTIRTFTISSDMTLSMLYEAYTPPSTGKGSLDVYGYYMDTEVSSTVDIYDLLYGNKKASMTTHFIIELDQGTYTLTATYSGLTISNVYVVEAGKTVRVNFYFSPQKSTIEIKAYEGTTSIQASVTIQGIGNYTTPITVTLNPGTYVVLITYRGITKIETITVASNTAYNITEFFEKPTVLSTILLQSLFFISGVVVIIFGFIKKKWEEHTISY